MKHERLWGILAVLLVNGPFPPRAHAAEPQPGQPTATVPTAPASPVLPQPLPGQLSSKFILDDANPEGSVPTPKERDGDPLEYGYFLQDALVRAEDARRAGDQAGVIKYYRATAKAVPENARAWSKLCEAYETVGDRDRAIRACRYALDRSGVELPDYARTVHLLLGKDGGVTAEDRVAIEAILTHLDKQPSLEQAASLLRCEYGVKANDLAALETCTKALARLAPDDSKTIVFQWNLAVQKGQRTEAEQLLARARKSGVVLDNLGRMEKVMGGQLRVWKSVAAGGALLALGFGAWMLRRRRPTFRRLAR